MINAEIIAIGSEMLTPFRTDTNSLWLTERLNSLGIDVKLKTIVGDDVARLEETIRDAMKRTQIVISTGGLGPTEDDLTKDVFAKVLNRKLNIDHEILDEIRARFERRGFKMPESNQRQAMIIEGSEILENTRGTAPGQIIEENNCIAILLPGPPGEMKAMFDLAVAPKLKEKFSNTTLARRKFNIFGLAESLLDELAAPIYKQYTNPVTTILAGSGLLELHLIAQGNNQDAIERLLDEVTGKLEPAIGNYVYSREDESLETVVGNLLRAHNYTLAVAESCTGGLLSGKITNVPGCSDYFLNGIVTYSNESKIKLLNVSPNTISDYGAVSEQTAREMAVNVRNISGSTFGIGITGVAGPGGGSDDKPVGLVYISLADESGCEVRKFVFYADRELNRNLSVYYALDILRRKIKN